MRACEISHNTIPPGEELQLSIWQS